MSDLDQLIAAAGEEQRKRRGPSSSAPSPRSAGPKPRSKGQVAALIVACVALAVMVFLLVQSFTPVSEKTIRTEIAAALDAAQASVEAYYAVNQAVPERVPLAALSHIVALTRTSDGCRLQLTMNGITLSRDVVLTDGRVDE